MKKMIIGITGRIGAGKTTVAKKIASELKNYKLQSSDDIVKYLYSKDKSVIDEIKTFFPNAIIDSKVNTTALGKYFAEDYEATNEKIKKILYAKIIQKRQEFIQQNKNCVLDVPLLFKQKIDKLCDIVIVVEAPRETRLKRVIKRGGSEQLFFKFDKVQATQNCANQAFIKLVFANKVFKKLVFANQVFANQVFLINNMRDENFLNDQIKRITEQIAKLKTI